jgi:hypothetical protein
MMRAWDIYLTSGVRLNTYNELCKKGGYDLYRVHKGDSTLGLWIAKGVWMAVIIVILYGLLTTTIG